jgi:oleandomycin transport system ATP-binding protein
MSAPALLAEGLVKRFGDREAVSGVDLAVPGGGVLALLGPNGAGKTTTVRILATLVRPDAGRAVVAGHDLLRRPDLVRTSIGLTGQFTALDDNLSGREHLHLIGRLLDMSRSDARRRAAELLAGFDLDGVADRLVRTYSGGTKRRLDLAASLVGRPAVLYLDEPTTGLDPRSRNGLWDRVRELAAHGTAVLLTTQYMEEAEALADEVVVMDGGRVIASGTSAALRAAVGGTALRVTPAAGTDPALIDAALRRAGLGPAATGADGVVSLPITHQDQLSRAVRALGDHATPIAAIETCVPGLDEVFLALTGAGPADPR